MTNKQRVHAVLEGKPVDRMPVFSPYSFLYRIDHYSELTELTGSPWRHYQKWLYSPSDEYLAEFNAIIEKTPFDILEPHGGPSCAEREHVRFVEKDGNCFLHDTTTDAWQPVIEKTVSGRAFDDRANEERFVFDKNDIDERLTITPAERQVANGAIDRRREVIAAFGEDNFILTCGVVGCMYACSEHVGLTNLFAMLLEERDLIEYLMKKALEKQIETIRTWAAAGGDAIFIDDATATRDMISPDMYERFCLPYMKAMVEEIHRLRHKAILIYFGGISDRLHQIADIGADGLIMEASMKGFVNDVDVAAETIGDRVTLFGNINPYDHLERMSDAELEAEMRRQARAGRKARGFVMSTGSPITPGTPLARVRKFIEFGRGL